jgi:hypothetical protein
MSAKTHVTGIRPIPSNRTAIADATVPAEVSVAGFVALSRFVVANGLAAGVEAALRNRPHLVEGAPGYLRMDVIGPLELHEELRLVLDV